MGKISFMLWLMLWWNSLSTLLPPSSTTTSSTLPMEYSEGRLRNSNSLKQHFLNTSGWFNMQNVIICQFQVLFCHSYKAKVMSKYVPILMRSLGKQRPNNIQEQRWWFFTTFAHDF